MAHAHFLNIRDSTLSHSPGQLDAQTTSRQPAAPWERPRRAETQPKTSTPRATKSGVNAASATAHSGEQLHPNGRVTPENGLLRIRRYVTFENSTSLCYHIRGSADGAARTRPPPPRPTTTKSERSCLECTLSLRRTWRFAEVLRFPEVLRFAEVLALR